MDSKSYISNGNIQFSQGNLEKAVEFFDKGLRLNPNDEVAWNNKGLRWMHYRDMRKRLNVTMRQYV
jgi:Flp pilus assembly protein TadD